MHTSFDDCKPLEQFIGSPVLQSLTISREMVRRLELIVGMGALPEDLEQDTRLLIQRAGKAFNLNSVAERLGATR